MCRLLILMAALAAGTEVAAQTPAELAREMNAIKIVESSGGKNTNHAIIKVGVQKGTRAGGAYGIMPKTAFLLIKTNKDLKKKYGFYVSINSTEMMTSALNSNHKLDDELARVFWSALRKHRTMESAACAWFRGPGNENCKDPQKLSSDGYVQSFLDAYVLSGPSIGVARN